jgi:hypothetical protein
MLSWPHAFAISCAVQPFESTISAFAPSSIKVCTTCACPLNVIYSSDWSTPLCAFECSGLLSKWTVPFSSKM